MKIDFYIDVYPGLNNGSLIALQNPHQKIDGSKRYKAVINIPDSAFTCEIDGHAPVEEVFEVDK